MKRFATLLAILATAILLCMSCTTLEEKHSSPAPYTISGPAIERSATFMRIKSAVDDIGLIDVHEHLSSEQLRLTDKADFFYLLQHYSSSDLVSAGMHADDLIFIQNPDNPLEEKWQKMAPYWPYVKTTGYGQALRIAARDIYGVPDIDETTWRTLSDRIAEGNKPGVYNKVLKEKAGIDLIILDCVTDDPYLEGLAPDLIVRAKDFDALISMRNSDGIKRMEAEYKTSISTLDDIESILDREFDSFYDRNIVAVKCKLAYRRTLFFEDASRSDAAKILRKMKSSATELPFADRKPLEDYIMHRIVERCEKRDVPVQLHTGLQEGNGSYVPADPWDENTIITDSHPVHLVNIIRQYPGARFDIFHGSFPYMGEMTTLAKNFPNVNLNLCWLAIISPSTCKDWLHRWIEIIPSNKIHFFGGDYRFAEGSYGHSVIARHIVTETLAEKVERGYLSEAEAIKIAQRILRENAVDFYELDRFLE